MCAYMVNGNPNMIVSHHGFVCDAYGNPVAHLVKPVQPIPMIVVHKPVVAVRNPIVIIERERERVQIVSGQQMLLHDLRRECVAPQNPSGNSSAARLNALFGLRNGGYAI
jgi:hypothetical protein